MYLPYLVQIYRNFQARMISKLQIFINILSIWGIQNTDLDNTNKITSTEGRNILFGNSNTINIMHQKHQQELDINNQRPKNWLYFFILLTEMIQ